MFSVQSQDGGAAKRRSKSRPSKAQLAALAKGRKALAAKRRKCNRLLKASQKGGASPGMAKFKAAAKMAGSMAKRSAQKAAVLAKAGAVKGARAATASARAAAASARAAHEKYSPVIAAAARTGAANLEIGRAHV